MSKDNYTYVAFKESIRDEFLSDYDSYGIAAYLGEKEVARVSDVSVDGERVRRLAKACTEGELSLIHLTEVIEDFLAEDPDGLTVK